ncbi:MAG: TRAP transporter substrate-binding protein [Rhodospirillaceae bacterium]
MKRRTFLTTGAKTGLAAGLAAGTGLAAPAIAQERIEWNMTMPWPKNAPGVGVNAVRFAEMVTAMSGGRLTIRTFGAGELVPPFEVLDAVSNNTAQLAHATPYYWQGKAPALNYFTTIPFGLSAWEMAAWLQMGDGKALWEEVYAPFGVTPFYAGNSGVQSGGWFNKEINSLDDLRGLKMRIAGVGGEVMRRLGVATVLTPPGEITPSLLSGAVDAAEWVGPWLDVAFGLPKAAKYYYVPAFHEPGPALEVIVNTEALAGLPADLQAIIAHAAQATSAITLSDFTWNNTKVFAEMAETFPEVELRSFPDEVIVEMGLKTKEVIEELAAKDPITKKVHDSFVAYNDASMKYASVFDLTALSQRKLVVGG